MLATRILLAMAPLASAMPLTGLLALASLAPQVQQCTHSLSTMVHHPDTTAWSSYTVASIGTSSLPQGLKDDTNSAPSHSLETPLAPLIVGGGTHGESFTVSSLTEHLEQCTHALSTLVILDDTTPWRHNTDDSVNSSKITPLTINVPLPSAVFGQTLSGATLLTGLPSADDSKFDSRRGEPLNVTFDLLQCRSLRQAPTRRAKSMRRRSWLQVDLVVNNSK